MIKKKNAFRISEEKRRILLVEDDSISSSMLEECLKDTYDILLVGTGEEALKVVEEQGAGLSIILLDLNLPGINGIEVLRRIKADPAWSRLPIIVMTSEGEAEVECLTLGAMDFIPKPFPAAKVILARILRIVELSEDRNTLKVTERDRLTGLYNKDFFYHYAFQLDQFHPDAPTDAIYFDINHFHSINDRFGKSYGDEVLKLIATQALNIIKESGGIVCRYEPDRFLFYCPHRTDYDRMLERMTITLKDDTTENNRVRLRMGVYSNTDKSLDIERRFDRAKMAADSVKDNLVNPIGYYDSSLRDTEVLEEQLIDAFPAAIRENQFSVYFQPKFDVRNEKPILSSAEALTRWKHPKLGLISPAVFIPLFEKNGLIQTLDHYVWREAARKIREWKNRWGMTIPVSVNVSRVDLYDSDLIEKMMDIVNDNGLGTEDLLLEITESAYTDNSQFIIQKAKMLRDLGFKIEMDDFGTGYSSLNMLLTLPIDALKLDMLFVRSAFGEKKDTRIIEAMIQLSKSLNIQTIAEGVETEEQVAELKSLGCDIIQGYYFSKPLPAEEFERFVSDLS